VTSTESWGNPVIVGLCFVCGAPFSFAAANVPTHGWPSVGWDPVGRPLCDMCADSIEATRSRLGLPVGWPRRIPR
jgi:hypothetical protein